MGRTRLEGGKMRPEGTLDVIWPDDRILIQNRIKILITASYPHLYEIICPNYYYYYYFFPVVAVVVDGLKQRTNWLFGPLNKFSVTVL